jgi:hypothetical protein
MKMDGMDTDTQKRMARTTLVIWMMTAIEVTMQQMGGVGQVLLPQRLKMLVTVLHSSYFILYNSIMLNMTNNKSNINNTLD